MNTEAANPDILEQPTAGNDSGSNLMACEENLWSLHFVPLQIKLRSILELLETYSTVLSGNESLAQHLNMPLVSNILTERINSLLKSNGPRVVERENTGSGDNISWMNVLREPSYQPQRQNQDTYQLQMTAQGVKVLLSAYEHDVIASGLLHQLVNPWSFMSDVQAEQATMELVLSEVSTLGQLSEQGSSFQELGLLLRSTNLFSLLQLCKPSVTSCKR